MVDYLAHTKICILRRILYDEKNSADVALVQFKICINSLLLSLSQNQTMDLRGIISISGKAGLFKVISQSRNGLIVETLQDGKRFAVSGSERVSSLEDISIFTMEEDILLSAVFEKINTTSKGKAILSHKSSADDLKSFMTEILPDYDEDRVYVSDIKKLVQWFNILIDKKIIVFKEEKKSTPKKENSDKKPAAKKTSAVAKKTTSKKSD